MLLNTASFGQSSIRAYPFSGEIELDGKLVEEVWQKAQRIDQFTQRELVLGDPATERTEVAVLYDEENLYIGVWAYDSEPEKIVAKELRRDFDFDLDDNFIVILDTYLDKRNGFMFVTNPNAARADLQVFNNGGSRNEFWNGVWDVRTTRSSEGWFAEFKIPFYALKYRPDQNEQIWGINFERNIRRKREQVRWQGWGRDFQITDINQAGQLRGLKKLRNERFIEVKPYALGGAESVDGEEDGVLNAGGDINALLSPTYRLNLTFNTDFAQVEADRQQINLTRFPLFFPELREFFLEGDDFFDFGFGGNRIIPFYTRRIGLSEDLETVPIIAGARLLGKEQNSTLGLMSIQTAADGDTPSTNYTTGSWRQDVGEQSVIGAMSVNKITDGRWHTTTGINGRYSTSKFLGNKNLNFGGAAIQTYNTDDGYDNMAWAYRVFGQYRNDKLNIFTSAQRSPEPFEPEVGLERRTNFREYFGTVGIRPRPKKGLKWIRQFDFSPFQLTYTLYDDTGELQSFDYQVRFLAFDTRKGETISLNYSRRAEGLIDEFNIFSDVVIQQGTYWWNSWFARFATFTGREISVDTRFRFGEFFTGTSFQNESQILWRASKNFNINLRYEKNIIDLPDGSFETDLVGSRIEYAFTPNIFGSFLNQWNTANDELNINFRLQVIPKIGTDFFFIINQIYDTESGRLDPERGTILAKLIWRFVL
ncbi:MAG: DUF5916 domain-containing protein [Bacteroidota bacterium]